LGLLHGGPNRARVGDIGLEPQGGICTVQGFDGGAQRIAQDVEHRHVPAIFQKTSRRSEANAARGTRDNGNLLRLRHHAGFSST